MLEENPGRRMSMGMMTICRKNPRGRGTAKVPVIGVRERGTGKVHAVVANRNEEGKQLTGKQLFNVLSKVCKPNTKVMTDQFKGYNILNYPNNKNLTRIMIDHNVMFSASNGVHTNGIESFWALLKRGIHGIFHHALLNTYRNMWMNSVSGNVIGTRMKLLKF